jgi:predicted CopG family antitoxin
MIFAWELSRQVLMVSIIPIVSMVSIRMAADPLTTIPIRASTRAELQRLKSGGQSYDDVIRAVLEELEERDPWFDEMEKRIEEWRTGKAKLEPIVTLREKDQLSRRTRGR